MSGQTAIKPRKPINGYEKMKDRTQAQLLSGLSAREATVLELIGMGNAPWEVRNRLSLSLSSVTIAMREIMQKLRFRDRRELRRFAARFVQSTELPEVSC